MVKRRVLKPIPVLDEALLLKALRDEGIKEVSEGGGVLKYVDWDSRNRRIFGYDAIDTVSERVQYSAASVLTKQHCLYQSVCAWIKFSMFAPLIVEILSDFPFRHGSALIHV